MRISIATFRFPIFLLGLSSYIIYRGFICDVTCHDCPRQEKGACGTASPFVNHYITHIPTQDIYYTQQKLLTDVVNVYLRMRVRDRLWGDYNLE